MKILKILEMAMDRINRKIWYSIFCVVIIASITFLVNTVLVSYNKITYVKDKTTQLIDKPVENTYVVEWGIADVKSEDLMAIKEEHNNIEGVLGAGMFMYGHTFISEFMDDTRFQKINEYIINEEVSSLEMDIPELVEMRMKTTKMLLVDNDISDLCKLEVENGSNDLCIKLDNGTIPVIAGYNYRDLLNVGDTFTNYSDVYNHEKYEIIGILKQGQVWLSENELGSSINYSKCLDNYLVAGSCQLLDASFSSVGYMYITDNNDKYVSKKVDSIINSYGYSAKSKTVDEKLEESLSEERDLLKMYVGTFLFLGSIGILTLSTISVLSVIITQKDIGIMYSIGFTLRDMKKITVMENILKVLTGVVIGFAISFSIMYYSAMEYEQHMIVDIEMSELPIIILAVMLIIAFVSVIIPIKMLEKYSPTELIGK